MDHLLIIDGKYLAYVALYSRRWLTLKGKPIGVVYGWWADLLNAIRKLQATHVTVTWDSRHLFRKEISKDYKRDRQPDPDNIKKTEHFYSQIDQIQSMAEQVNLAQNEENGLEADDLIALHCRRFPHRVTIYSSDNDLFQLLSDRTSMYSKAKTTTVKTLQKAHDCSPSQWSLVKALAGCPGDNVVGVKGIGVKTAVKIIQGNHKKGLADFQEIMERNLSLVKLPYPLISHRRVLTEYCLISQIDWKLLKDLFLELEFQSLLKNVQGQIDKQRPQKSREDVS